MSAVETLGKYEVRRQLGRGASGTVYEGWDPVIKRQVAIKTVPMPTADDDGTAGDISRFRREAEAAGRLHHPNIVGVFDYGETSDVAYIVMEYIDGPTLKAVLDSNRQFPLPRFAEIMEGVLAGLQYSHERGVVHRDIKPANLMLTAAGDTKIADFGIARIDSSSMTQAGTVLGTPAYMSPEQFLGQVVDARSDIYSAGALLYQLLTGKRPFDGSMSSIMHKALYTEARPPSQVSITAPRQFDAVIQRALAKRPEDRFSSAKDFADAIRASVVAPVAPRDTAPFGPNDATIEAPPRKPVATLPAPATSAIRRRSLPPPTLAGAIARTNSLLVLIGGGFAGLLVLGSVAWFLLPGSSTILIPRREQVEQTAVPRPVVPAPAADAVPPPADRDRAVVSPGPANSGPETPAAPQVDASLPGNNATPTTTPPPAVMPPPASMPTPLEQAIAAARLMPCSALNFASTPEGIRISGFARSGPELDQIITRAGEAGRLTNDVTQAEPFACAPIEIAAPYTRQSMDGRPGISIKLDQREPTAGMRFGIGADTSFPVLYVDLYQSDGSVRHLIRPALGVQSNSHTASAVASTAGPGLIMAIGAAKPLDVAVRPETEPANDYLTALRLRLADSAALFAVDLAMVTVHPAEPVVPKARPVEPVAAKPVAPPVPVPVPVPVPRPRPAEPTAAKAPLPHAPSLRSARCSNIVSRAQLGETLSDGELTALRTECRS